MTRLGRASIVQLPYSGRSLRVCLNRSEFDAASFCEKDAVYVEALPDRAA
jgi:hypothetical protein